MRMTFDQIKRLERALARLERHIKQIGVKCGQPFCANGLWLFYFKPVLYELVGFDARPPALRPSEAYDVTYQHLYNLLPDCRHEDRICG